MSFGLALALLSCAPNVRHADLAEELKAASRTSGLALVLPSGNRFIVIPFDGEDRYIQSGYQQPVTVTFSKTGKWLLWYRQSLGEPGPDLLLTKSDGQVVKRIMRLPGRQFSPEAFNEASNEIAFTGTRVGKLSYSTGLYWANFDFSQVAFVAPKDGYPSCDWHPCSD